MIRQYLRNIHSGPLRTQLRRFAIVGAVTSALQLILLWLFVRQAGLYYLIGALVSIEITIIVSYVLNNLWTFATTRITSRWAYLIGLLKTNIVRGSAIPIQLVLLYLFVDWGGINYIISNAVAIGCSGIYRYILDAKWTWGQ